LNEDGFQFIIFTKDHAPAHVHVKRAEAVARVRLQSVEVMDSVGFNSRELSKILSITEEKQQYLLAVWDSLHSRR
jgi:uncharacterized protein (DUF885 family)